MNSTIAPSTRTVTNGIDCSIPAFIGTGTVEGITTTKLLLTGGNFLQQDAGQGIPYKFSSKTFIIIGAAGPVMTTEIIRVSNAQIVNGDYSAAPVVPDSSTIINLERPTSVLLPAGTIFYFCDPAFLSPAISTMLSNMTATAATYTDPSGGSGTILGLSFREWQTTPERGAVLDPLMVDATGTNVEISNQYA